MSDSESNIRKYVWTFRKCKMIVENAGEYTLVKKTPEGETQETIVTDDKGVFGEECTIEDAQLFMDNNYPGHIIIGVKEVNALS